jgi:tRNA threonylcarbamoyladenosine biosynthesis protein TsaB
MRILAIDTALTACAAAVYDSARDKLLASESLSMERGHAEALLPLVARVMDAAGSEFSALDRIAVTVGPGSFTGLRVGIAAARGIALAASKAAVGVSTLSAFAAPCIAEDLATTTLAAIDARHDHVYAQAFGPGGRTVMQPGYIPIDDVMAQMEGEVHLAGSAALILAQRWPASAPKPILLRPERVPEIAWVARLGAVADAAYAPPKPLYLRHPDAKPQASPLPPPQR